MVVNGATPSLQFPALCVIWGCCAIVGLAPAVAALAASRHWRWQWPQTAQAAPPESGYGQAIPVSASEADRLGTAIQP